MAKLGFIGDTHFSASYALGYTDPETQLNTRLLDFANTFNSIIDTFEQKGVQVIAICGDIFDVRNPAPTAVSMVSKCLRRALDKNFEIVLVAGNHDQIRTSDSTTIDFLDHLGLDRLTVFTKPGVKKFDDFNLIMLPYRDRKQLKATTNEEAVKVMRDQLNDLTKDLVGPKIVVGHFMAGAAPAGLDGENFSINEIVLPLSIFSDVDFACLGHIHEAKVLRQSNPPILYAGSMEKITFGDRNSIKSTIIVDTDNLASYEIMPTEVRKLFEISFDYSEINPLKSDITERILKDTIAFAAKQDVKGSILRLTAKLHDCDVYYVNQDRIRDRLIGMGVSCLAGIQLASTSSRQLRDDAINENEDSKKAFKAFVGNLKEPDSIKKRLLKFGEQIIEEIEGK